MPATFNKVGSPSQQMTTVHSPVTNTPPIQGSSWGSAAVAAAQAATPAPRIKQPTPPTAPAAPQMPSHTQPQAPYSHSQAQRAQQPNHSQAQRAQPQHSQAQHSQPQHSQAQHSQAQQQIMPPHLAPHPPMLPPLQEPTVPTRPHIAADPPKARAASSRWAAFERLGLKAPMLDRQKWSGRVVNAYRALGFVILTIIVVVLIGYLITTAFFYMSNSWIVPMAISPTDEKVVSLQAQLAERQTNRDRTAAELDQAERAIAVQQEFQLEFAKAIKSDLEGRKAALQRMYELSSIAASTRAQIKRSNSAYASQQQKRMAEEWKAGLIDRDAMLNGKFQIAQISGSNLSLAERQAEYETRAADLDAQTRSLEALLASSTTGEALSYDVLKIKQEYEASRLETQRAIQNRDMLKSALERDDKLLESLKKSSYLRAIADEAHVAFVPYANLEHVKKGETVYGCWLTMVFCGEVGTVIEVLPGEVQFKHPTRDKMLRGQMVELKLAAESDATDDVLFVGGRPLLL
ncbi:MAG TPA: hypothetical protein VIV11_14640 [Kofleriaceae bacterium]